MEISQGRLSGGDKLSLKETTWKCAICSIKQLAYHVTTTVLGPGNSAGNKNINKNVLKLKLYNILNKCYIEE